MTVSLINATVSETQWDLMAKLEKKWVILRVLTFLILHGLNLKTYIRLIAIGNISAAVSAVIEFLDVLEKINDADQVSTDGEGQL